MSTSTTTSSGYGASSLDRVVAALDAAGRRYQQQGTHVQASCPGSAHQHDDRHPSLSIDYDPGQGRTSLHCFSGDSTEEVLDLLGLDMAMLYDDWVPVDELRQRRGTRAATGRPRRTARADKTAPPKLSRGPLPKRLTAPEVEPRGEWEVAGTWEFHYPDGSLAQQEVKSTRPVQALDPVTGEVTDQTEKTFRPRWPDGQGGWITKKAPQGYVSPLYRAPQLAGWVEQGVMIHLAEGPKDADNLAQAGVAATSNASGAGSFEEHHAQALDGAHVVVWIDRDKAGYQRGLGVHRLLEGKAVSVHLVLPTPDHAGADASDHLAAGHTIEDAAEVTTQTLAAMVEVATVEDHAAKAHQEAREAQARAVLHTDQDTRHASRWAGQAGRSLDQATRAARRYLALPGRDATLTARVETAVETARAATRQAYDAAGEPVPEYTQGLLTEQLHARAEDDLVEDPGNVVELPATRSRHPKRFPMDTGIWGYSTGEGDQRPRGVYRGQTMTATDPETGEKYDTIKWENVAPLPWVHSRIQRVDGEGNPTGTLYLVSAAEDGHQVVIGWDELRNGSWPNVLGLRVPLADKILRAAGTALTWHAEEAAPVTCATPETDDEGRIHLPAKMPVGYLQHSPMRRDQALAQWAKLLTLAAQNPRLALVLGASAAAPFVAGLSAQSHVMHLHGEAQAGKTTTITLAASMWGNPGTGGRIGTRLAWNSTAISVPTLLGAIGLMPAFFDEIGQAGDTSDSEWHQQISNIAQGAFRLRTSRVGQLNISLPWRGIFFSSGNAAMTGGEATGRHAGTPRRIIELEVPFTNSEDHNDQLSSLGTDTYGHIGHAIIDTFTAADVAPLIAAENAALAAGYETKHHSAIGKHLALHLAGAQMLDQLCGTGDLLTNAARQAAEQYLAECQPPKHDADHLLEELADSMAREPEMWPSKDLYREHLASFTSSYGSRSDGASRLRGGLKGIRWVDPAGHEWVGVFAHAWKRVCAELGIEGRGACRELDKRELLRRPDRQRGTNVYQVMDATTGARLYQIRLPEPDEDDDGQDHPDQTPDTPQALIPEVTDGISSQDSTGLQVAPSTIAGGIAGASPTLSSDVAGIAGIAGDSLVYARARENRNTGPEVGPRAPCIGCGLPAVLRYEGQPLHPTCEPPPASAAPERPAEDHPAPTPAQSSQEDSNAAQGVPEAPQEHPATPAPRPRGQVDRKAQRAAGMEVEASEITEVQRWAETTGNELTEAQAAAVVQTFHQVTGCRWKGPHGTIWSLLTGHTKWPGAKEPQPADLGLFEELRESTTDQFWTARSWILTPGNPAPGSLILGVDVNMQYVASAASVELGEGNPIHYEDGDAQFPPVVEAIKKPGWVRLRKAVTKAPHGLQLPAKMWVPTPLAVYLARDHKITLSISEALLWDRQRKALSSLSGHFRDWALALKAADDPASSYALEMVKTLYTKTLGGYLASEAEGMTPPQWHRPDWAMLLRAQAEVNMLRGLDQLPAGITPRAKYADAAFLELDPGQAPSWQAAATAMAQRQWTPEHATATGWTRRTGAVLLDPVQSGRWKTIGPPLAAGETFEDLRTAEAWRATYYDGQERP